MTRYGGWIETYTGIAFYPLDPRVSEINIDDIAHSLSLKTRFNGHCDQFYSVADHSIRVANKVHFLDEFAKFTTLEERNALCRRALLHDAAEAYLCDIPAPIKPHIKGFNLIEKKASSLYL